MQGDKEIRNKLAETEENVDMLHGAIQILVGGAYLHGSVSSCHQSVLLDY